MPRRIVVIQGHPDAAARHLGHALADAYAEGAESAGHDVQRIAVAELDFPLLRRATEWESEPPPPAIAEVQSAIAWADHLVIVYPLWLGTMPALLKGFMEQVFRPGFAIRKTHDDVSWHRLLKGKTARIVVTMGMPAVIYRWYFGAHSLKGLERNILRFVGISSQATLIGGVGNIGRDKSRLWFDRLRRLGSRAE